MKKAISIVMPVYNGEQYLSACINSVLSQRMTNFELLIGDDCSTDASAEIINSYSDGRIRCFSRKKNIGLFKNLNQLIIAAEAPLVHILCQDDILETHCLDAEINFFGKHPDSAMSFCKSIIIGDSSKELERGALGDLPEVIKPSFSVQLFYYYGSIPGNLSTVCIRKSYLEKTGLFDESFGVSADYELWTRLCRDNNLGVIHDHLVRLRAHSRQLSRRILSGVECIRANRKIRALLFPTLPRGIREEAQRYVMLRQNVLDTHLAVRYLIAGRFKHFFAIAQIMGRKDFMLGLLWWFITVNNHMYQPSVLFCREE